MTKTFTFKLGVVAGIAMASVLFILPLPTLADTCVCANSTNQIPNITSQIACDSACGGAGKDTYTAAPTPAPTSGNPAAGKLDNPLSGVCSATLPGQKCVQLIIGNVIKAALGIVGSIALLIMTYGGFRWLTAMGNSERVEKGKETLIWAALGLAVIFGAYAVTSYIITKLTTK